MTFASMLECGAHRDPAHLPSPSWSRQSQPISTFDDDRAYPTLRHRDLGELLARVWASVPIRRFDRLPVRVTDRVDGSKRARGAWGENRAARHLRSLGFDIVGTGWRPPERELQGDIDVVARRDGLIVFCEVKARRSSRYGGGAAAVTPAKQAQVRRLAESWLLAAGSPGVDVRFDVIAIDGVRLTHYRGAF